MADSSKQPEEPSATEQVSSSGRTSVSEEVREGEDPLSYLKKAEDPGLDDVDSEVKPSVVSQQPRRRSGAVVKHQAREEEAATVGGGDGVIGESGLTESDRRASADAAVRPTTVLNGMCTKRLWSFVCDACY